MFEQTKALCDSFLAMGIPCFDLLVCKDGEPILRYMGGYADPEKKIPMTGKEKYHIYSCSKLITCVAAMQLWEQGKFSLEDKLSDYLPAFKEMKVKTAGGVVPAKNPILIHQLFQMTSGMNYDLQTPALKAYYEACGRTCPTVELVNHLAETPLEFEPGESWRYSLAHDVLAALVEVVSGQNFEEYVQEHIFKPLGMKDSTFLHPQEDWEGFPRQFVFREAENCYLPVWRNIYRPGKDYCSGGAGAVSTVEDFTKFLQALCVGDVILKKETIEMMAKDRLTEQQREAYTYGSANIGYGLGMRTPREGGDRTEFGWGGAAGAFASADPVNGLTIYYAQHVLLSPNRAQRAKLYYAVLADLRGETITIDPPDKNFDPSITY